MIAADGRRIRLPGKRIPANSPAADHPDVHDQTPAAVGARRPRAVPAVGDGRGGRARARRVPAALRRAQAPDRARRGDPAQRPPPQRPRREHPRGRPQRGRRALEAHPLPARRAPARPRRDDHALALPAPPGLPRGLRQVRDPLLGRLARLPDPEHLLRRVGRARGGQARRLADGAQQHQPPVDHDLVARQRAGGQPLGARHRRPGPGPLHRGRRGRGPRSWTTRGSSRSTARRELASRRPARSTATSTRSASTSTSAGTTPTGPTWCARRPRATS